ncbi:MAG: hypothetical protein MUO26_14115 [Methanotrichaceae archaeon]|nr:hypothetical protein [Methanotrichaceae archaeon]
MEPDLNPKAPELYMPYSWLWNHFICPNCGAGTHQQIKSEDWMNELPSQSLNTEDTLTEQK